MDLDIAKLAARYRAGAHLRDLAAEAGCSHETVRRRLRAAGVERRKGGLPRVVDLERLRRWIEVEGWTQARCAAVARVTQGTISEACRRHRIGPRKKVD